MTKQSRNSAAATYRCYKKLRDHWY